MAVRDEGDNLLREFVTVFVTRRGTMYGLRNMLDSPCSRRIFISMRHTAASIMVQRNVPLPYIREILGHASITTTMMYAHTAVEHLRRSVQKLDPLAVH